MAVPLLPAARFLMAGASRGALIKGAAKKITKDKLLGEDKKEVKKLPPGEEETEKGTAIVKVDKKSVSLVPYSAPIESKKISTEKLLKGGDTKKGKSNVSKVLESINKNLQQIKKYFENKKKSDLEKISTSRKNAEIDKKKKREDELERKRESKSKNKIPSLPGMSFFDRVINFFSNILIGSLLNILLANKDFIFKALDDISKGLTNTWNLLRLSIITISQTAKGLIKSVAKLSASLLKGPVKFTGKLLKKLGTSLKNVFVGLGKFVVQKVKNLSNIATGGAASGATRATGAAKRVDVNKQKGKTIPQTKAKTTRTKPTGESTLKKAKNLFGDKGTKHLGKVSKVFKKVPFIGALIGIGIDLAMGERLDNAIAGAAGASLGASIGAAIGTAALPIPFVGTFLGGVVGAAIGDWAGKEIYKNISGQIREINPPESELRTTAPPVSAPDRTFGPGFIEGAKDWGPLLSVIRKAEGGWESISGRRPIKGLTGWTIQKVANEAPSYAGAYQLNPDDVVRWAADVGLKPTDLFSPENQSKIAVGLIEGRARGVLWKKGKISDAVFGNNLANIWAGLPLLTPANGKQRGQSYYAGVGPNKANVSPEQVEGAFGSIKSGKGGAPVPAAPTPSSTPPAAPVLPSAEELDMRMQSQQSSQSSKISQATLSSQPSQIPQNSSEGLTKQTSYEMSSQIIPIPIMSGGGQQIVPVPMVSGGGGILPIGVSREVALNNYYKSQFIGFLYKQG